MLVDIPRQGSGDMMRRDEIEAHLTTSFVGRRLHILDTVDSTSNHLWQLAQADEMAGSVVLAEEQTAGRGRRGRVWFSPKGKGLWFSVLFRPSELQPWGALSLATAVSVSLAVEDQTGLPARVKWPNDVRVNERKVAGGLVEVRGAGPFAVVLGVGVSVNVPPDDFPEDLLDTATSLLSEGGLVVAREPLFAAILNNLEERYLMWGRGECEALVDECQARHEEWGPMVEVQTTEGVVRGRPIGIGPDGHLLVTDAVTGATMSIAAGEVSKVLEL